jgi:hypothetical protein
MEKLLHSAGGLSVAISAASEHSAHGLGINKFEQKLQQSGLVHPETPGSYLAD